HVSPALSHDHAEVQECAVRCIGGVVLRQRLEDDERMQRQKKKEEY
ncbi:hypothetical protein ADUPG1_014441, partial [Aduncisulcus paluster]